MGKTNKSVTEITEEWNKLRPKIAKIKGDKCFYCGAKATEYHHIVPRHMGGDNRLENIVPMCYECHSKAHSKRSDKHRKYGRKRIKKPDNFDLIADIYLGGHITLNEALNDLGLKRSTFYRMLEDYKQRKGGEPKRDSKFKSRHNFLDEVIRDYLDSQITHGEALEITRMRKQEFNKKLYEYRQRTGDRRIPKG